MYIISMQSLKVGNAGHVCKFHIGGTMLTLGIVACCSTGKKKHTFFIIKHD